MRAHPSVTTTVDLIALLGALALLPGSRKPLTFSGRIATKSLLTKTLTIQASSGGDGVVSSNPAGINCTVTGGVPAATGCKAQFQSTAVVILTAVPKAGHAFKEWFGYCSGSGTCSVPMTVDRTVGVRFFKGPFLFKIVSGTAATGSGTVKSQTGLTPVISCTITSGTPGSTGCSATYPANTAITLTATPATGSTFGGWGAPCSGTGACSLKAVQPRTISASFASGGSSTVALEGKWETAFTAQVVAIHLHLLPTGKVLLWGHTGQAYLWDPAHPANPLTLVSKPAKTDFFCSGHAFLPDGRLLVAGGTMPNQGHDSGRKHAAIFDPSSGSWSLIPAMAKGRYYPTITTLPGGRMLIVSGADTTGAVVGIPEIWDGTAWHKLTTASLAIPDPFYPAMFVAPNGKLFLAGFPQTTRYLDFHGTGTWTTVADRKVADRRLGSAVMYAPGKILFAGGGDPPTASAEVIDLNQAAPAWRSVSAMAYARRQMNATILPDGKVLVTNGTSGAGFNDTTHAVHYAELWNPTTESWAKMARETSPRTYHSTALLLPDARVLSTGSGEGGGVPFSKSQFSAEVFSPPYLFNANGSLATRPTITSAPSLIKYQQSFAIQTPNAGAVTRGALVRLSAVTHAFNTSQVIVPLTLTSSDPTTLNGVGPMDGKLAPPGPYMLFLLSGAGVPSVAKIVAVGP